jgi:hypothetical protein
MFRSDSKEDGISLNLSATFAGMGFEFMVLSPAGTNF